MKAIIATAITALSLAAPAAADQSAKQFFALTNDSPAETIIGATSSGDVVGTAQDLALVNDSPAENSVSFFRARNVDVDEVRQKFAAYNDSPAEN